MEPYKYYFADITVTEGWGDRPPTPDTQTQFLAFVGEMFPGSNLRTFGKLGGGDLEIVSEKAL